MADHLFIYGTLPAVAQHPMGDLLRAHGALIGPGSIQARLYIIDDPDAPGENSYPGAVPSPDPADRVQGEVWDVQADHVWPQFDTFEACSPDWPEPHEFLLRRVSVRMADGRLIDARSYLYTWDVSVARHKAGGAYVDVSPDVR